MSEYYFRVLKEVYCGECGFEAFDTDFEKFNSKKVVTENGVYIESDNYYECPKCSKINTMVLKKKKND